MTVDDRVRDHLVTAAARATMSGRPVVATVALPGPASVDPLGMVRDHPDAFVWFQPDLDLTICAVGRAVTIAPPTDAARFDRAADALRELRLRTMPVAVDGAERRPVLVGGFSFDATFGSELETEAGRGGRVDETGGTVGSGWAGFPAGRLVLPEVAYVRKDGQARWIWSTEIDPGADDSPAAADLLATRMETAVADAEDRCLTAPLAAGALDHDRAALMDLRDDAYVKTVAAAVDDIGTATLSKVVVARQLVVDHLPDPGRFLARLRKRYPTCATFGIREGGRWFCGATPERLVAVDGVRLSTAAVAGTAPRGIDATQDEVIADRLRHDPKEIEEHRFVIDDIRARLAAAGVALDPVAATEVMRLPGIQHLHTPIAGAAPVGTNLLDLVGALHPTSAVGGLPFVDAAAWLAANERLERGWYAGPVGYTDLVGDGEFRVALRSVLIDGERSRLFAGAGIVAGSNPERELEETGLKLGALLAPLLGA